MAKIVEQLLVYKISTLARDSDQCSELLIDDQQRKGIEQLIQDSLSDSRLLVESITIDQPL